MTKMMRRTAPIDMQDHLSRLEASGLLTRITRPIDKDSELHPLARWQFQGGLREEDRRGFLFTNVTGAKGERYDIPVAAGVLAASAEIYAAGLGVKVEDIGDVWVRGMANPIEPVLVEKAPCQEVVITGEALSAPGGGLAALPVPISTPGFDAAPYLTATLCVTRDPDSGIRNLGTYRAGLKAQDRLGVRMASRLSGAGGYLHWLKYQKRGEPMPCAIVVGCAPAVLFTGPQKLPIDQDELSVAGGLIGEAVRITRCKTVDLEVPADAEIIIEGLIDTELLEPEGPFGESHGHVALEDFNMSMRVTAITRKSKPVLVSIISQVTPSESSVLKRVAYEPLFLDHLKSVLNVKGINKVVMHEALTNVRPVIFLQFDRTAPQSEVWRGLQGAATLQAQCGKIVIACFGRYRRTQRRRRVLVDGVSRQHGRRRARDPLPVGGTWTKIRRAQSGWHIADRCDAEAPHATARASGRALHAACQTDLGRAGIAAAIAAAAMARLFARGLERSLGPFRRGGGQRGLASQWREHFCAAPGRHEAGDTGPEYRKGCGQGHDEAKMKNAVDASSAPVPKPSHG